MNCLTATVVILCCEAVAQWLGTCALTTFLNLFFPTPWVLCFVFFQSVNVE